MTTASTKTVLDLILKTQEEVRSEITEIKKSVVLMARLDEKMVGQQSGLERIGGHVDKLDTRLDQLYSRMVKVETRETVKAGLITWLAAILASIITGVVVYFTRK